VERLTLAGVAFWTGAPAIGFVMCMLVVYLVMAIARWIGWYDLGGLVVGIAMLAVLDAGGVRQRLGFAARGWTQAFLILPTFVIGQAGKAISMVPGANWMMPMVLALMVPTGAVALAAARHRRYPSPDRMVAAGLWLVLCILGLPTVAQTQDGAYVLVAVAGATCLAVCNMFLSGLKYWTPGDRELRLIGLMPWTLPLLLGDLAVRGGRPAPVDAVTPDGTPTLVVEETSAEGADSLHRGDKSGPRSAVSARKAPPPPAGKMVSAAVLRSRRRRPSQKR
jgi:hypothetical protein